MTAPDDRRMAPLDGPTALELLEAVREWLATDLLTRAEGADRWAIRIAANALSVVGREMADGPAVVADHRNRLQTLGHDDERSLCRAIRSGGEDERFEEILDALERSVTDSIAIANPTYRSEP